MRHASRNWKAVETNDLIGAEHKLAVTGEVQVRRSNEEPRLTMAVPQGIAKETLILDLTVKATPDVGGEMVLWKAVMYEKKISTHQYNNVMVRGDVDGQTIQVEEVLS